ncbi:MAG: ABC transporter permease, partial [Fusobacteriaceae bacterium]
MDRYKRYLYAIPFLIFITVFYIYGFFYGVLNSFGYYRIVGKSFFTLEFYKKIFEDRVLYSSFIFTLKISFISAIISMLLSIVIIYLLFLNRRRKVMSPYIVQKLVESPLLAPYIIGAYSILLVFMQNGVLSMILQKIGIIESYRDFPILTNDKDGYGIIITYLWKTVPFIVMMSMPVVKRVSDRWDNLA